MTDIVERLRETGSDLADDAADEIERLRVELTLVGETVAEMMDEIERLRKRELVLMEYVDRLQDENTRLEDKLQTAADVRMA